MNQENESVWKKKVFVLLFCLKCKKRNIFILIVNRISALLISDYELKQETKRNIIQLAISGAKNI